MTTIAEVAKWFLRKEPMNPRKLQVLCYYAQAWHYALFGKPLFEADFEAWEDAPASPELYQYYQDAGYWEITIDDFLEVEKELRKQDD